MMGLGEGKGEDQTTNVVAGSCCAICCGVCFLVIGLPMLIAGVVLVQVYKNKNYSYYSDIFNEYSNTGIDDHELWDIMYKVGIAMIVVSVLCVVIGVIMVILLCTGCCGHNQSTPSTVNQQVQYGVQPNAYVVQQGYDPNQPAYPYVQQPNTGAQPQQQYYTEQQTYPQKI